MFDETPTRTRCWPDGPRSRTIADVKQTGRRKHKELEIRVHIRGKSGCDDAVRIFFISRVAMVLVSKNDSRLIALPSVTSLVGTTWRWPSSSGRLSEHGRQHRVFKVFHLSQLAQNCFACGIGQAANLARLSSFHGVLDGRGARNAIFGDICYHIRKKL